MRTLACLGLVGLLLSACGARMVVPDLGDAAPADAISDGVVLPDVPRTDAPIPPSDVPFADVPPATDVPFADVPPPTDVPFPRDVPFADVPPPFDVPFVDVPTVDVPFVDVPVIDVPIVDVPTVDVPIDIPGVDAADVPTVDAPPPSLAGNWRLVQYTVHNADGTVTTFTDTDTALSAGGITVLIRTNGMLFLANDRISENIGFLINDHFFADNNQPDFTMSFSTFGFAAPGTLSGSTFTVVGGGTMVTFRRNADGTISQTDAMSGNVATWTRMASSLGTPSYSGQGQATLWMPTSSTRFGSARVTLAWDAPGTTTLFTNDQPIAFGPFNTALYDIAVTSPPAAAITGIAGTQVALAYVLIYDDVNRNASFDRGTDVLRAVSPVALAWRGGPASVPFQTSVYRNLDFGFQVVHLQPDFGAATNTPAPYDPTHPVTLDAPVNTGPSPTPIPNAL